MLRIDVLAVCPCRYVLTYVLQDDHAAACEGRHEEYGSYTCMSPVCTHAQMWPTWRCGKIVACEPGTTCGPAPIWHTAHVAPYVLASQVCRFHVLAQAAGAHGVS